MALDFCHHGREHRRRIALQYRDVRSIPEAPPGRFRQKGINFDRVNPRKMLPEIPYCIPEISAGLHESGSINPSRFCMDNRTLDNAWQRQLIAVFPHSGEISGECQVLSRFKKTRCQCYRPVSNLYFCFGIQLLLSSPESPFAGKAAESSGGLSVKINLEQWKSLSKEYSKSAAHKSATSQRLYGSVWFAFIELQKLGFPFPPQYRRFSR